MFEVFQTSKRLTVLLGCVISLYFFIIQTFFFTNFFLWGIGLLLASAILTYYYIFIQIGLPFRSMLTFSYTRKEMLFILLGNSVFFLSLVGVYYTLKANISIRDMLLVVFRNEILPLPTFVFYSICFVCLISLLSNLFFQGFLFLNLQHKKKPLLAHLLSAGLFGLVYAAPFLQITNRLFGVAIFFLFAAFCVVLNFLNQHKGSIYTSLITQIVFFISISTMSFLSLY